MSDDEDFTKPVIARDGVIFVQKGETIPDGYTFRS
jgi:hypothetical protein